MYNRHLPPTCNSSVGQFSPFFLFLSFCQFFLFEYVNCDWSRVIEIHSNLDSVYRDSACRSAEFSEEGSEGWEGGRHPSRVRKSSSSVTTERAVSVLELSGSASVISNFFDNVGESKETTLNKYRITDRAHVQSDDRQRTGGISESEKLRIREKYSTICFE